MITWSHEAAIATVDSGSIISFSISAENEMTDPITMEPVIESVSDLKYEKAQQETEVLPDHISIQENGTSVDISGTIKANAPFIEMAYSDNGEHVYVDKIEDIPSGAKPTKLIPSPTEYKYFRWRVYSESNSEADRTFTLTVIVSWDDAKQTIIKLVGEIE